MLEGKQLQLACEATPESWDVLEKAMDRFAMSARAHQRIWRVARTIADLANIHMIEAEHVGEALSLRYLDRGNGQSSSCELPRA
jgi:magnesium chelatase family protein